MLSKATAALIFLSLVQIQTYAELKGKERDDFVYEVRKTCLNNQLNDEANKNIKTTYLKDYCSCIATYFADKSDANKIILESAKVARNEESMWMDKMKSNASSYCLRSFK